MHHHFWATDIFTQTQHSMRHVSRLRRAQCGESCGFTTGIVVFLGVLYLRVAGVL